MKPCPKTHWKLEIGQRRLTWLLPDRLLKCIIQSPTLFVWLLRTTHTRQIGNAKLQIIWVWVIARGWSTVAKFDDLPRNNSLRSARIHSSQIAALIAFPFFFFFLLDAERDIEAPSPFHPRSSTSFSLGRRVKSLTNTFHLHSVRCTPCERLVFAGSNACTATTRRKHLQGLTQL